VVKARNLLERDKNMSHKAAKKWRRAARAEVAEKIKEFRVFFRGFTFWDRVKLFFRLVFKP